MIHRKRFHKCMVRKCSDFIKKQCRFQEKFCWFVHETEDMEIDNSIENDKNSKDIEENEKNSVFQKVKEDLKPPQKKKNQKEKEQNVRFYPPKNRRKQKIKRNFSKTVQFMGVNSAGLRPKLPTFKKVIKELDRSIFFVQKKQV